MIRLAKRARASSALLLAVLATSHVIPGIHQSRQFAEAGGLISDGTIANENSRQGGIYTDHILNPRNPPTYRIAADQV
jgi:hypothetical protein